MRDALLMPCVNECGNTVDVTTGNPWEEHKGFARKRDQGGLHGLSLRKPTGRFMRERDPPRPRLNAREPGVVCLDHRARDAREARHDHELRRLRRRGVFFRFEQRREPTIHHTSET